jgi:cytoskeletal protein RodZ
MFMLEKIAEELHEARVKRGISLQQIAVRTRIDIKFLEAIDKGDFTFLPDPYVKAFIKEFAKMVGLDETKIILKYDACKKGKLPEEVEEARKPDVSGKHEKKQIQQYNATSQASLNSPSDLITKKMKLYGAIVFFSLLMIFLIYLVFFRNSNEIIVAEKPIEEIIEGNQQRFVQKEPEQNTSQQSDSLVLSIYASDTSWVKIIVDDTKVEEFILFPNSQKSIKAVKSYKMTLGNSGAIKFQMNDKPLNFSGKVGSIAYVQINKAGVTRLKSPPTLVNE